jgi:hypothetical protein
VIDIIVEQGRHFDFGTTGRYSHLQLMGRGFFQETSIFFAVFLSWATTNNNNKNLSRRWPHRTITLRVHFDDAFTQ